MTTDSVPRPPTHTESETRVAVPPALDVVWISDLGVETCWRLVGDAPLSRVGFVHEGRPLVLPINHVVDEQTIVFRTSAASSLGALVVGQQVALEVDDCAPDRETGWSVVIAGEIERMPHRARRLVPGGGPSPWAPGERDEWLRIVPSSVTGKVISRRRRQSDGVYLPYMPPGG